MSTERPNGGGAEAVVPRATYGSGSEVGSMQHADQQSWRRHVRVGALLAMGCAMTLLCLSVWDRPGGSELEEVVSPPVMGTGGGPTTPPVDDGSEVSDPVMGSACIDCPQLDGPTVMGQESSWHNYSIDYNVFGLHVYEGGLNDADAPGALPDDGRNEWENTFGDYDFQPSHRHDGPDLQAEAIMKGVQHYGEVTFNGYPRPVTNAPLLSELPSQPTGTGTTLAGGAGTTGDNSAASQADLIVGGAAADQAANSAAADAAAQGAIAGTPPPADNAAAPESNGGDTGGNEKGGAPSPETGNDGSSVNGDNAGGGTGGVTATVGGTETGPATGNNCYLLPDLCPQYALPAPGMQGAGANVAHVDGEPQEEAENDGSAELQHVNPEANITSGDVLGAVEHELPADPPPPTPAPYTPNLVFDTSADNGAGGMGETIQVDTSRDAIFVGGAPVATGDSSAEERGRPTELAFAPKRHTRARMKAMANARLEAKMLAIQHPGLPLNKLSDEFEDTGGEDTSKDADLQDVDNKLQKVMAEYSKTVGTINFGSRGMTDKRNDFLEGTSGSKHGGKATSASGSKKSSSSELVFAPTGMRVIQVSSKLSDEFEDTGGEDTSKDADLQDVDNKLQKVMAEYSKTVGTINFGSRGMTDKRNDFLEGTSGSKHGGKATSASGSKQGYISELVGFVPTGMRVLPGVRKDRRNQMLEDVLVEPLQNPGLPLNKLSDEFEDTGGEDTSKDADLQDVDNKLQKVMAEYSKTVGTINFGSRGMTDKRNDFLEGTSGSKHGGKATSAPGSA